MIYGIETLKNSVIRAENAANRAAARRRESSGAERENALNQRILRNIREASESEALARLFACNLYAGNKPAYTAPLSAVSPEIACV